MLVAAVDTLVRTRTGPDKRCRLPSRSVPGPPPATGPRTLAGCFCAEVLPGASSKPNLPAIKSIIKFDTAKRSPKRLLPSRPSHSPVTALRRQPWLFSLTTYRSAAPRCRILPLTWISIWINSCIITHHNEGLRNHYLDIRLYERRLLLAGSASITWYESRDLIVSPRLDWTRLFRSRFPTKQSESIYLSTIKLQHHATLLHRHWE